MHCVKPSLLRITDVHFRVYGNAVLIGSNISLDSTYHLAVVRYTSKLIDISIEVKVYVPVVVEMSLTDSSQMMDGNT